uniref:Major facilitator superfamily (MFS) profile domain-containing protein n=1 Tax=Bionectria ochroleuca TaxID=29856 RepID=A0A8H7N5Y4_BIOOC
MALTTLRNRLPAPRYDQLARQAKRQATGTATESQATAQEPSPINELASKAPAWYASSSRRKLYFLLFPACVVSYATSGYDGSMMNSLQTVSYWDDFFGNPAARPSAS